MSYILDALNKSEAQRREQPVPGVESLGVAETRRPIKLWHVGLIALVIALVNGAGLYWLLGGEDAAVEATPPAAATPTPIVEPTQPAQIQPANEPQPQVASPLTFGAPEPSPKEVIAEPTPAPPIVAKPKVTMTFADLPTEVQRRVPEMQVTSHIYSSEPSLRMVKIDDVPRKEGDELDGGVLLVEITELGVVLGIDHHRFRIDILQDWNP